MSTRGSIFGDRRPCGFALAAVFARAEGKFLIVATGRISSAADADRCGNRRRLCDGSVA